jgi:hypothetical protein
VRSPRKIGRLLIAGTCKNIRAGEHQAEAITTEATFFNALKIND